MRLAQVGLSTSLGMTVYGLRMRWNFSSRAADLSGGDAIVLSVPKSGRTWVRVFFSAYFCKVAGREFVLDPPRDIERGVPRIVFTHDNFEHRTKGSWWDRVRGKYRVPQRALRSGKIVLLVRDPRDTFVSLYVQLTRRATDAPADVKRRSVHSLLRDSRFGIEAIVAAMNGWLREFADRPDFMLLRYESLRAAPPLQFRSLLEFIGGKSIDEAAFAEALSFSNFENMQRLEAAGAFTSTVLQPGNPGDPESFKVRRGKIGGYSDYLNADDERYVAAAFSRLDPRFGYGVANEATATGA